MSAHQPKWNALYALTAGALSFAGERRLRAHVDACATCAHALASLAAYELVRADVREASVPTADGAWERLASALSLDAGAAASPPAASADGLRPSPADPSDAYQRISAEVRLTPAPPIALELADRVLARRARERDEQGWAWAAALAAAACFALATQLFTAGHGAPEHAAWAPLPPPPAGELAAPAPEAHALDVQVRAMSGVPRHDDVPLQLGTRVAEGERCETGEHDSAHFSVGEGSGFALSEQGSATVERARVDGVVLSVERGALSSSVAPGTPYRVLAPPFAFEVRGTRFSVARRDDGAVSARVAEGSVAVMRGDELLVILGPGDTWSSGGAAFAPEPRVWNPEGGVAVRVPAPDGSPFVAFEAESVMWDAHADVVLTVREGASLHLTFFDARGRPTEMNTRPVAEGATVEAPVPSRLVRGHLPASVISAVVRQHRSDLDFCVSRAVRMAGRALDEVTLGLTITPEGSVSDVQLTGPGASLALRACMTAKARAWLFPRPGGSLPVQTQVRLAITPG